MTRCFFISSKKQKKAVMTMDEKVLEPILQFLGKNWGYVLAAFSILFEITPIKIHPITTFLGWIGKKLTGDIRKDIADLREDVDMQRLSSIRSLVLDFSNSCLNGRKHTKEEFDHILDENKNYEQLVSKYEDKIQNDVYKEAIEYIKRIYRKRMDRRDFLSTPAPDLDEEE